MAGRIIIKNTNNKPNVKILKGENINLKCLDDNFIHVWTDGGGNCGPASIGVVIVEKGIVKVTYGEYLGDHMTNNIAELTAIFRGLQLVKNKHKKVKLYSDSNYSLQSISGAFNGRKNRTLIDCIIKYIKAYPVEVIFVKVKGHAKLPYNEMADSIAGTMLQLAAGKLVTRKKK